MLRGFVGLGGIRLSNDQVNTSIDAEHLERQISNLRTAMVILIIVVTFLFGYIILQPFLPGSSNLSFGAILLFSFMVIGFLLLVSCLSAVDRR